MMIWSASCTKIGELPTEVVGINKPSSVMAAASIIAKSIGPIIPWRTSSAL